MSRLAEEAAGKPVLAVFPGFYNAETYFAAPPAPFPATPTGLWVGTSQRVKNPELLAAAWRVVMEAVPDARLIIAGSSRLHPIIRALHNEHRDRICVYAHLAPSELRRVLDSATALILPSRSEGLSRVTMEAFARGRPVIGTRVEGITDLVKHGANGLLTSPDDAAALAEAIIRLISDRALAAKLGQRARADAETHRWTSDRYARAMLRLIQDAMIQMNNPGGKS
jgi:glycosyltransferase involved in cell wall biosynthesis